MDKFTLVLLALIVGVCVVLLAESPSLSENDVSPGEKNTAVEGDAMKPNKNQQVKKNKTENFTLLFVGLIVVAYVAFFLKKPSVAKDGLRMGGMSLWKTMPVILAGFAMAGLLQALIPKESLANWLGSQQGIKAVFLATLLGAVTPGPIVVPLAVVAGLAKGGAGIGSMLSYLVAWDVIAVRKVPMTVAFWGNWRLAAVKCAIGLPVTLMAGILANWLFPNLQLYEP